MVERVDAHLGGKRVKGILPDSQGTPFALIFEDGHTLPHNWAYPLVRLEAMLSDAGLKVEHSESFKKEMEFEPWADRMNVSAEMKTRLRAMPLGEMIASAREFLTPRVDGDKLYVSLTAAIIIGRKG